MSLRLTEPMSAADLATLGRSELVARCSALEADLERHVEGLAEMRALKLGTGKGARTEWGLTPKETIVFGVLMAREIATKDALYIALYSGQARSGPDPKVVDVFVCKLRSKVERHGVIVENRWGEGWFLSPASKARARELMAAAPEIP